MKFLRLFCILAFLGLIPVTSYAQPYTSVVVFGDSLSDSGNLAHLTQAKYGIALRVPGPAGNYADGRATDGLATLPPARNYTGLWIEQLAAGFTSRPAIVNSLDGGTNYAYAYASTGTGVSTYTYGPGNLLSVNVNNMTQQVADYLATSPTINNNTLYVVWGGANALISATSAADVTNAALQDLAVVQRLIGAGATEFLVPNLPPLGAVPRFNGSSTTSIPTTQAATAFNQALAVGLATLPSDNPGRTLHVYALDIYSLFLNIIGPPVGGGLVNATASSQGNAAVNPDTYLFWDDLHPTTSVHHLIAQAAAALLSPTSIPTTTIVTSSAKNSNLGTSVTFTATVTPGSVTAPVGTVTFADGGTVLGTSSVVAGTGNTGIATYVASRLTEGTHSITATFTGVNGFANSTSGTYTQSVTSPAVQSNLSPTSITVARGATGTSNVVVTPVGGFTGTVTLSCGTLPAHLTCSFSPSPLTFTSTGTAQNSTLTVGTKSMSALSLPWGKGTPMLAWVGLPFAGMLITMARRRTLNPKLCSFLLLSLLAGICGCAGNNDTASAGTYTVPVNVTTGGLTATLNLNVVVQ